MNKKEWKPGMTFTKGMVGHPIYNSQAYESNDSEFISNRDRVMDKIGELIEMSKEAGLTDEIRKIERYHQRDWPPNYKPSVFYEDSCFIDRVIRELCVHKKLPNTDEKKKLKAMYRKYKMMVGTLK